MNRKDPTGNEGKRPRQQSGRERVERAFGSGDRPSSETSTGATPVRKWTTPGTDPDPAGDGMAIDPEELREFLSADGTEVSADPAFKQALRQTLWKLVEDQYGLPDEEPEGH
jgi:hypothetical protein